MNGEIVLLPSLILVAQSISFWMGCLSVFPNGLGEQTETLQKRNEYKHVDVGIGLEIVTQTHAL